MVAQADRHEHFISLILPIAKDEETRSGIKPLISMTQSAHESNWGTSGLTEKANNLFGFTGEKWESEGKPVIKMPTQEWVKDTIDNTTSKSVPGHYVTVLRPFRAYGSWAESLRDWANLMQFPRYVKALAAGKAGELEAFAKEVSLAGYATDPNYTEGLLRIGFIIRGCPVFQKGIA